MSVINKIKRLICGTVPTVNKKTVKAELENSFLTGYKIVDDKLITESNCIEIDRDMYKVDMVKDIFHAFRWGTDIKEDPYGVQSIHNKIKDSEMMFMYTIHNDDTHADEVWYCFINKSEGYYPTEQDANVAYNELLLSKFRGND